MMQLVRRMTRCLGPALVAIVGTAVNVQAQGTATIEGTVTSAERPLADATVMIVGTTRGARSDESGRYRITGISPGSYQVRAQRIGYTSITQSSTVSAAQTATLNFALKEAALSLDV